MGCLCSGAKNPIKAAESVKTREDVEDWLYQVYMDLTRPSDITGQRFEYRVARDDEKKSSGPHDKEAPDTTIYCSREFVSAFCSVVLRLAPLARVRFEYGNPTITTLSNIFYFISHCSPPEQSPMRNFAVPEFVDAQLYIASLIDTSSEPNTPVNSNRAAYGTLCGWTHMLKNADFMACVVEFRSKEVLAMLAKFLEYEKSVKSHALKEHVESLSAAVNAKKADQLAKSEPTPGAEKMLAVRKCCPCDYEDCCYFFCGGESSGKVPHRMWEF